MEFTTPEPVTLHVKIPAGTIHVTADKVTTSVVQLEPVNADDEGARKLVESATIGLHGGELVVEVQQKLRLFRFPKLRLRVTVPLDSTVRTSTGSADLRVTGRIGGLDVKTASGDVEVEQVVGRFAVNSASGDVRIGTAEGSGSLRSASGDVGLGVLDGESEFRTASGDLTVDELTGALRCHSASGDVRIGVVDRGEIKVNTASGDIEIGVREGVHAWLDLNTASGTVGTNLDTAGEPPAGEPDLSVKASTASGDILLSRAP